LFIINYGITGSLTLNMYIAMILAAIVNGPTEEIYWRACMEDAGINAGVSEKWRLIYTPIAFSLWHTAFVIHLYPWDANWFAAWGGILLMTWASGIIWHWVLHRSGRLVPQSIYHAIANVLNIFPLMLVTILQISF
jgi:membrane protease YdiL (CAAX protease family)